MQYSAFVYLAMFGWIPFVLVMFSLMRPVNATIVAYIGAWLFLPMATFYISGFPDFGKMVAASGAVMLGVLLFDTPRLHAFRPHWVDIPMVVWCLAPFATSISNDLGVYNGLSELFGRIVTWWLPYFTGRLYFNDLKGLRQLVMGIVAGGLLYVPFCLWELRMAPTLHASIYGFAQHSFKQHIRYGGYRPMVFMQNGLAVAIWMAMAGLLAIWMWRVGREKKMFGLPAWLTCGALIFTTVLCKSVNALVLLAVGMVVMCLTGRLRSRVPLLILATVPMVYMYVRVTQTWTGRSLVELTAEYVDEERAHSLEARLIQEDLFSAKAWQQPALGWGGFGRMLPTSEVDGTMLTRGVDGMWTIAFGSTGLVGLVSLFTMMLLPAFLLLWRCSANDYGASSLAVPGVLAVLLALYTIDCLFNGMWNPVFGLCIGGVGGFLSRPVLTHLSNNTYRVRGFRALGEVRPFI